MLGIMMLRGGVAGGAACFWLLVDRERCAGKPASVSQADWDTEGQSDVGAACR